MLFRSIPGQDAPEPRWKTLHKTKLEPKHISLLWRLRQGAVTTARQLKHFIPEVDGSCPVCHAEDEDIRHYFLECPRIQRFWHLVEDFLKRSTPSAVTSTSFKIDIDKVIFGFHAWSGILPNADALHGLAVWEIFRAHTEASIDNKILTPQAMFARWRQTVLLRIIHDFFASHSHSSSTFQSCWLNVSTPWFAFEPGGVEQPDKLSIALPSFQPTAALHSPREQIFNAGGSRCHHCAQLA